MINKTAFPPRALLVACLALVMCAYAWPASASDAPRISKEDLKGQLGSNQIVVVDVRTKKDWDKSSYKIRGSVREDPNDVDSWIRNYPKGKTIVLYCA